MDCLRVKIILWTHTVLVVYYYYLCPILHQFHKLGFMLLSGVYYQFPNRVPNSMLAPTRCFQFYFSSSAPIWRILGVPWPSVLLHCLFTALHWRLSSDNHFLSCCNSLWYFQTFSGFLLSLLWWFPRTCNLLFPGCSGVVLVKIRSFFLLLWWLFLVFFFSSFLEYMDR